MATDFSAARNTGLSATLKASQIFAGLSQEDLSTIASFVVSKTLHKGEYLFMEGGAADGFYIMQRGAINVHRVSPTGKEQIIHVFTAGQSFAEAALAGTGGYPADARAIEESVVLLIPRKEFSELLRHRPELALRMLASMSQHLRVLVSRLDDLTLKDVETRLSNWLLKRCPTPLGETPVEIELDRTKRVLAAEIGTVSETLSRTFARLREQELLEVEGKKISIPNPKNLEKFLRHHLGES